MNKVKIINKIISSILIVAICFTCILPAPKVVYAADDNGTDAHASLVERALSAFVIVTSVGAYALLSVVAGGGITIEDLIFNGYNNTKLTFFEKPESNPNKYLTQATVVGGEGSIYNTINDYFSFFTKIAILAYMIILVYMGIRILLGIGAARGAKYKDLFMYWVQGVLILFFFPYVIKYTIALNDAFVGFIYDNKTSIQTIAGVSAQGMMPSSPSGVEENDLSQIDNSIEQATEQLKNDSNEDYMSTMFRLAWTEGWVVYAICWAVMVHQLIGLFIIYFKRLLTTIFLIAIFPLVTISYAIDKVGDGKSQAFGNWYKEFALNIFLQSFHAIVYVIGMALILTLGAATNTPLTDHWLLIILILGFIAKGDDILKTIFNMKGGGGETVKGIGATMLQAKGATTLAKGAASAVAGHFGANSFLGKATSNVSNMMNYGQVMGLNQQRMRMSELEANFARAEQNIPEDFSDNSGMPMSEPGDGSTLPDNSAPMTLQDYANIAFDQNATAEEREQALQNLNNILNSDNDEAKKELMDLLKNNPNALTVLGLSAGMTEVELKQKIEIILETMRKNNAYSRLAQSKKMTPPEEEKFKRLSNVKFKKPEATKPKVTSRKSTVGRKKGLPDGKKNRYEGVFVPGERNFTRAPKQSEPRRFRPKGTSIREMAANGVSKVGARFKAANNLRKLDNKAYQSVRNLNCLQRRLRELERQGKAGTKEYLNVQETIAALNGPNGSIAKLNNQKRQYAEEGIFFFGIGKTQKAINRNARENRVRNEIINRRDAVVNRYKDVTTNFVANRKADKAIARTRELRKQKNLSDAQKRELEQLEAFIDGRVSTSSVLFGRRPCDNGKVKFTKAQRTLNKDRYNNSMTLARRAVNHREEEEKARKMGKMDLAKQHEEKAKELEMQVARTRKVSLRGYYDPNDTHRNPTRAQKLIDKSAQKRACRVMKQAKKDGVSGIHTKTVREAAEIRNTLRDNGVLITRASTAETMHNKLVLRQAKRGNRADSSRATKDSERARKSTYNAYRHAGSSVKVAEDEVKRVHQSYKGAATDKERVKAKKDEEVAIKKLNNARSEQTSAERVHSKKGAELRKRNVKLVLPTSRAAEEAKKAESAASRSTSRIDTTQAHSGNNIARNTQQRRTEGAEATKRIDDAMDTSIKLISESEPITPIRSAANRKDAIRQKYTSKVSELEKIKNINNQVNTPSETPQLKTTSDTSSGTPSSQTAVGLSEEIMREASAENFRKSQERSPRIIKGYHSSKKESKEADYSYDTSQSIVLNSELEVKKANDYVDEVVRSRKNGGTAGTDELYLVAASVAAINHADTGTYTASEMVEHIDNIRNALREASTDPDRQAELQKILSNLEYDLDDFDSNLRIQVLNDPSLLSADDPNRSSIINSSILHVQSMEEDDILLNTLRYNPNDLSVGQMPISRYGLIDRGNSFIPQPPVDNSELQRALAANLIEQQRQANYAAAEQEYMAARANLNREFMGFLRNAAGVVTDMTIGMPTEIALALTATGSAGGADNKESIILNAGTTALSAYNLTQKGHKFVQGVIEDGVNSVSGFIGDRLREASARTANNNQRTTGTSGTTRTSGSSTTKKS